MSVEVDVHVPVNLNDEEGVWLRVRGPRGPTTWENDPRYYLYVDEDDCEIPKKIATLLIGGAVKERVTKIADEQYKEGIEEQQNELGRSGRPSDLHGH